MYREIALLWIDLQEMEYCLTSLLEEKSSKKREGREEGVNEGRKERRGRIEWVLRTIVVHIERDMAKESHLEVRVPTEDSMQL